MTNPNQNQTNCSFPYNSIQCVIYDKAWRFCKIVCGVLVLVAFLIKNYWLVLISSLLIMPGIFSLRFNILYQFYLLILTKLLSKKLELVKKELGEIKFVSAIGWLFFLVGFLLLYFGKFVSFVWIYVLMITAFMLLGGFTDFCLATAMYIFFKKIFKSK